MCLVADAALGAIRIQFRIMHRLAENAIVVLMLPGAAREKLLHRFIADLFDVPSFQPVTQRLAVHRADFAVQSPASVQLTEYRGDAALPVHTSRWRLPTRARPCTTFGTWRDSRSISFIVKSTPASRRDGKQVQYGVGRSAHGDIQRHRISNASKVAMLCGNTEASSCT